MIIKRLKYLAVCLLVLLNVVSTMGGSNDGYKYYNSQAQNIDPLCLSFRNNSLIDCCKQDSYQQIYIKKTGPSTGIFHIKDYKKVLCYDKKRMKFKVYGRRSLGLERCRHQRRREREHRQGHRSYSGCSITGTDIQRLKHKGCELHDFLDFAGFFYISAERNSKYLGLRRGRKSMQKHKRRRGKGVREPSKKSRKFMAISGNDFVNRNGCGA